MEPRIQYAKTKDGVSIAFYTLGEGMPYVLPPTMGWGHYQLEWEHPDSRAVWQELASRRTLIRFDRRGTGLATGRARTPRSGLASLACPRATRAR